MGIWALFGLGALNMLEGAVVEEKFSAGGALGAEEDILSNKA